MTTSENAGQNSCFGHVNAVFAFWEKQPTFLSVDKEILLRALESAEIAKEFSTELLTAHDESLGRTTCKNKMWADQLLACIAKADQSINELRQALGQWPK